MRRSLLCTTCAGLLLAALPASANTMNYGELEQIFGEPVTTSATGSPQRASEAPVDMEIVSADDIRRSGADNIPDVLRMVAGMDVRQYGPMDYDVSVRGYNSPNSPRVLVLLNGRQIYIDYHSYTAWSTFPAQLGEIRQIEVIKGPNTALFGFNAVGGVINIVTYDPIYDKPREVTVQGGTQHDEQASAIGTIHFADGSGGLRLSAGEQRMDESNWDSLVRVNPPFSPQAGTQQVYADGRYVLPSGVSVNGEFDTGQSRIEEMTVGEWPDYTRYSYNREKIGVDADSKLGYLSFSAYSNNVDYWLAQGFNCSGGLCQTIDSTLYVVQLSDLLKPGIDHTVRLGLEYRNSRASGTNYSGMDLGFDVMAASAMWNWQMLPDLTMTNSVRFDHMTYTFSGQVPQGVAFTEAQYNRSSIDQPSFNSALRWAVTDVDAVRLSVARGVQTPDIYDTFPAIYESAGGDFEGSPILKPTTIMNYEIDWDRAVAPIESKIQLATFYQTSRDILAPPGDANLSDATSTYAGNIGQDKEYGGELTLKGSDADGWRWKAAYALAQIDDQLTINQTDSSLDFSRGVPHHSVILGLGRSWDKFEADVGARWQSSFDETAINTAGNYQQVDISNYWTTDARLGYKPVDGLTLAVSGSQLNSGKQLTTNGLATVRRVLGSVSVKF